MVKASFVPPVYLAAGAASCNGLAPALGRGTKRGETPRSTAVDLPPREVTVLRALIGAPRATYDR